MTYSTKRRFVICTITFSICLSMLTMQAFSLSLEQEVSRRQSMRSYTSENMSRQQLLDVLWAAYGHTNDRKNIPRIGYDYSLIIFTVNETGSYQYIPESNSLVVHDLTVNKETIRPHDSGWPSDAKEVLVIVLNETRMDNQYFASAEAGCLAQNVHLAASSLGLGTCVVGTINSGGLRSVLQLPNALTPLLVMPLSYPTYSYPAASPKYDIMTGNLPPVQYSELSFEDAVRNIVFAQEWSAEPLSVQELSQLLWAAYGYSSTDHRTTPSSYGIYPLVIYVSNATGVYKYLPESHSVTEILDDDKRLDIANAFSGQAWAADAPTIFLIGYDSSYNSGNTGDGGVLSHLFMEINTGCVIQQLFLEASAWNLKANIISEGLEEWNGAGAQELRNILGLSASIIPLYAIPVGAPETADRTPPTIGAPVQDPDPEAVEPDQTVTVSVEVTDEGTGVSEVVLSYSTDEGQTWTNTTMNSISVNTYTGEISGFEEGKHVQYKILAYDNSNNLAVEDNAGDYHIYTVIPEFQNFLILIFMISTLLAVILTKKRNSHK
ncbi:MAG: hypothetical protein E3J73_02705 [Candidatus Bathyarchaeum sp.]|nr:MAG: hypothetical protein E3J73_02705 [Candidatus Bathyarchaeum sp.]